MSEKINDNKSIIIFRCDNSTELSLPFADGGLKCGFPSPAQDYVRETIDLNHDLVRHPASTFYGRVVGDSMIGEGIEDGDILVIDKSITAENGDLAVCCIDGEFTVKRVKIMPDRILLVAANPRFKPIEVLPDDNFTIWGVVTYTIKQTRRSR